MKKTEYFTTDIYQHHQAKLALQDVVRQRDQFLLTNENVISKIDIESAEVVPLANVGLLALLKLTYFQNKI